MNALGKAMMSECLRAIRDVRRDRQFATMIDEGWTIAVQGSHLCINVHPDDASEKSFNFVGLWNDGAVYWAKELAEKNLVTIQLARPLLALELIHQRELRDRTEKSAMKMIRLMFNHRHAMK